MREFSAHPDWRVIPRQILAFASSALEERLAVMVKYGQLVASEHIRRAIVGFLPAQACVPVPAVTLALFESIRPRTVPVPLKIVRSRVAVESEHWESAIVERDAPN